MLYIILPAFNEARALRELLPDMLKTLQGSQYRIVVVDDGSTDNTADIARSFSGQGVVLVQHEKNKGLPEALRSGLSQAAAVCNANDAVITLDSDNTHPVSLIPLMAAEIDKGHDIVVASRFAPGGREIGLPWYRKILSRGAGWTMKLFFHLPGVRDYSCGYRAYRAEFLQRGMDYYGPALIESKGFAVSVELLLKLSFLYPKCSEVPLVLRYDLKQGKSKLPFFTTVLGYLGIIYSLRFKRKQHYQAEVEA